VARSIDRAVGPRAALEWAYKLWGVTERAFGPQHPETAQAFAALARLHERVAAALAKTLSAGGGGEEAGEGRSPHAEVPAGGATHSTKSNASAAALRDERRKTLRQAAELWRQCLKVFASLPAEADRVLGGGRRPVDGTRPSGRACLAVALAQQRLGSILLELDEGQEACALLQEAAVLSARLGETRRAAALFRQRATAEIDVGRHAAAAEALRGYLEAVESLHGPDSLNAAMAMRMLGVTLVSARDTASALPVLQRARRLLEAHVGPKHRRVQEVRARIDQCRHALPPPGAGQATRTAAAELGSRSDEDG
jgi:tetratricopeptide (TPR) repeat protein